MFHLVLVGGVLTGTNWVMVHLLSMNQTVHLFLDACRARAIGKGKMGRKPRVAD